MTRILDTMRCAARARLVARAIALLVAVAGVSAWLSGPVRAGGSDLRSARAKYPDITGTDLDSCALCHVSDRDLRLDPYGSAYDDSRRDFAAIEGLDSDGDGFTNLEEILALTFPGKPESRPSGTPPGGTPTATETPTVAPSQTASPTGSIATATRGPTPSVTSTLEPPAPERGLYLPWAGDGR